MNFNVTADDRILIAHIARRAAELDIVYRRPMLNFVMDITACHANGNPLDLPKLLAFDDFNFGHDVFGIEAHLDRETGKLGDCFSPRCSV